MRQISVETALAALEDKSLKVVEAQEERTSSPLDNLAFSLHMVLRASNLTVDGDTVLDELAEDLSAYLNEHEGWRYNERLKSQVRLEVYRRLLPYIKPFDPERANTIVDNLLKMQRITA